MELSTWLITSLSPGGGEKMSKHGMPAGNVGALLARFAELRRKAFTRTGESLPITSFRKRVWTRIRTRINGVRVPIETLISFAYFANWGKKRAICFNRL